MNITFVTNTKSNDGARTLFTMIGFPYRNDDDKKKAGTA